jgi:hypothetical protein
VMHTIKSKRLMEPKMRCGSELVDSYIKYCRQKMRRFVESMCYDSSMRVERRRLKAANENKMQENERRLESRNRCWGILLVVGVQVSEKRDILVLLVHCIYLVFSNLFVPLYLQRLDVP